MAELVALAAFSFVSAVTPGPNNVMLWASGVQFGWRRTVPHIAGIVFGVGSIALLAAAGLGVLITTVPAVETGLKIVGSIYLLYLAYRIVGGGSSQREEMAQPLTLWQAALFQYVNPKAWVFVLAAVTTFRPPGLPVLVGSVVMATVMMVVVIPCAWLWAAGGSVLSKYLADQRRSLVFRMILGLLLAASVAYIWI